MEPAELSDANRIRRAIRQQLESLERAGVTHWKKPPAVATATRLAPGLAVAPVPPAAVDKSTQTLVTPARLPPATPNPPPTMPPSSPKVASAKSAPKPLASPASLIPDDGPAMPRMPATERPAALEIVAREVAKCVRCQELASTRTQTVFGTGDPNARLCFLGEAPGADEDASGEPFVGRAGQLLTDMIVKGMKLRREDVYILNVLKCRPPGNRPPAPDEVENCSGFLQRQLQIIRPEFICCLGAVAAQSLLKTPVSIGKLRGRFHKHGDADVICTYHPAYLLRNPSAKKDVWEDLQVLMKKMGMEVGER